jgi:PAS domain S-box-containing protein
MLCQKEIKEVAVMSEHRSKGVSSLGAISPGDSIKQEHRSNGEAAHVEPSGKVVRSLDRASDTAWEITPPKHEDDEPGMHEEILQKIFDHIPVMISLSGADGPLQLVNREWERTLGWSQDEVLDRGDEIFSELYPDPLCREEALSFMVRAQGEWKDFKTTTRDGRVIDTAWNRVKLSDGTSIGIGRDITDRRRAEEALREAEQQYRNIFENSHEGIFQTSEDGRSLVANPALARMLGFDSPAELIQNRNNIAQQGYLDPARRDELRRLLDEYDAVTDFEFEALRKDGSKLWISENVRAVRDQNGAVLYYEGTAQDITERKLAEKKSASFAALARKLSGAITALSAAQIIADTAHDLFGWDSLTIDLYDADHDVVHPMLHVDTIGGRLVDVTPPSDSHPLTDRRRRVIQRGGELIIREEPYQFDNDSVPFGDKSRPSAALMYVPIRQAANVVGFLSIQSYTPRAYDKAALDDLQALADHCGEALNRIRTEQSLYESEERYRDLVENSRELICTHDLDGLILSANRAATEVLGYDPSDYVRRKNLREILAPEVRHEFGDYLTRIRQQGFACGQMLVQTCRGERRIWEYYNSLRTEGVTTPIVRGMAHDITERKRAEEALRESEERYRELFENAKDAMYVHDLQGRYTSINCAAEKLTGYSREEILGRDFGDFVVPEHVGGVRDSLCRKLADGTETVYEVEVLTRDGRRVPVEVNSRLIHENGIPVGVQGTVRDITERKHSQAALQNFSRRLMEAQEAERQRLSRELHDEIGQVLTAVRINLETVQRDGNAPAVSSPIEDSLNVIDEALRQVRDMSLDLRPPHLDDFGLSSALRWYIDRYAKRAGHRVQFIDEQPAEQSRLREDLETACFRIVQEGLTNVARHANAKSVSVRLARSNGHLVLTIEDDGIGFEVDALRRYATANATLGVRGMEERAEGVGGRIEIESAKGKGTKILARFPVVRSKT